MLFSNGPFFWIGGDEPLAPTSPWNTVLSKNAWVIVSKRHKENVNWNNFRTWGQCGTILKGHWTIRVRQGQNKRIYVICCWASGINNCDTTCRKQHKTHTDEHRDACLNHLPPPLMLGSGKLYIIWLPVVASEKSGKAQGGNSPVRGGPINSWPGSDTYSFAKCSDFVGLLECVGLHFKTKYWSTRHIFSVLIRLEIFITKFLSAFFMFTSCSSNCQNWMKSNKTRPKYYRSAQFFTSLFFGLLPALDFKKAMTVHFELLITNNMNLY